MLVSRMYMITLDLNFPEVTSSRPVPCRSTAMKKGGGGRPIRLNLQNRMIVQFVSLVIESYFIWYK